MKILRTLIPIALVGFGAYWIWHRQLVFVAPRVEPLERVVVPPARVPIVRDVEAAVEPPPDPTPPRVTPPHPAVRPDAIAPAPISMDDRLPWENMRVRREIIRALEADIAKIRGYGREKADRIAEVRARGGFDAYLAGQEARLHAARTRRVI